jgi:LuxR family transcriptional regulator/LuxR family quorum-sensing system transcriptional regulator CciR
MNQKVTFSDDYFFKILHAIKQSETLEQLLACVPKLVPNLVATYHHFGAVGAFDYNDRCEFHGYNVPPDIFNYLDAHRKLDSNPAVVAVLSRGTGVWLSELIDDPFIIEVGHEKLTQATLDLTGDALCLPLYGPNNRTGYMFLAFGVERSGCDEFLGFRVETLANRFHVRYCLMLNAMHKHVNLTSREAQVLELITHGKTNAVIADILGISTSTVGGYVKSIFLKLDVSDRVSAAMRAQTLKVKF